MTNYIGIDKQDSSALAGDLNELLATYEVYYQNLRACHWNVKGENFFELHAKFEELYVDAQVKIDDVAERMLTLGIPPLDSFSGYIQHSKVSEISGVSNGKQCVEAIRDNIVAILELERNILDKADGMGDSGTSDLMTQYISAQEKVVWMLSAFLA